MRKGHAILSYKVLLMVFLSLSIFSCAVPPKANRALGQLLVHGNNQKAWEMIMEELRDPSVSSQEDLCELHVIVLQILSSSWDYDFIPADADRLAETSYKYVLQHCMNIPRKVMLSENQYGNFLQNTKRPGLALPHYRESLRMCRKDTFDHMLNENNVASCYADMGQFELRDLHRKRAIEIGRGYFKTRRSYRYPYDEANEWRNLKFIMQLRLDDLSWMDSPEVHLHEMHALWNEIEPISRKWISKQTQYLDRTNAIQRFATAGDTVFARKLLEEARVMVRKYPIRNREASQLDLQVAEAMILLHEGRIEKAAALYKDWAERFHRVAGKTLDGNSYRLAGLAQEQAGHYDSAIEYLENSLAQFEKTRGTFKVEQRTRFLSGLVVTAYWGLIRSYAQRYMQQGDEKDFIGAIRTARMLRARQFGELIGLAYDREKASNLSGMDLKPDELLLNIIVTDRALVIFALGSKKRDLFLVPFDAVVFNRTLKAAKEDILNPNQHEAYVRHLQEISRIVLDPVRSRIGDYRRIIVIPDGLLNGIPFNLLSKSRDRYSPLIHDHEVVLTPSISYLIKQRHTQYRIDSDRVLAVADPDYGSRGLSGKVRGRSEEIYKRAIKDLNLFTPLPETRTEVFNLSRLFRPGDVTSLLGHDASETRLKAMKLEQYRYLHFATHGILGRQIPEVFEPALVLAEEPPTNDQDGYLTLSEVEKLRLNSELAVLSACDTGSGKYFTGEGVMGLSRAFLLSGSRAVIVSLWPVASDATVELMGLFYKNLRKGKSKAESLRSAQLELMKGGALSVSGERGIKTTVAPKPEGPLVHPFYWAPFVLIGE